MDLTSHPNPRPIADDESWPAQKMKSSEKRSAFRQDSTLSRQWQRSISVSLPCVNCICVLQTWPAKGFCYRGSALRLLQPVATANKVVNASWQSAGTQTLAKVTSARTHTRPGHTPPINTHPNTHGLSRRHMSWSVNERAHLLGPSLSPAAMEN